jgi:4-hydroxybenzoate polyprenyltransferase
MLHNAAVPFLIRHLLPMLQLTRMALVFTAIADSLASMLLLAATRAEAPERPISVLDPWQMLAMAICSVGLYGFGMSLNDIIDRRRDTQLSPTRPLPSGRIALWAAHLLCAVLGLVALAGGIAYGLLTPEPTARMLSIALVTGVLLLIVFYDVAGKYLVWAGLLTLGLIRFFHATIAAPQVPVLWHPLWLFNHVALLSTICYVLEEKRPALTRGHVHGVAWGMVLVNAGWIALVWMRRRHLGPVTEVLSLDVGLLLPAAATLVFVLLAILVLLRLKDNRGAGQTLMLYGLLWLIVYDAAFVWGYVGWRYALVVLSLFPLAYLSVQAMRAWGRVIALGQKPQFRRAT